jgi:DNA mismatch repair protein MutS2
MDAKTLLMLEYPKVLERLCSYASFSASIDLGQALRPSSNLDEVTLWQAQTSEARQLLDISADVSVGGAHDVRPLVDLSAHGGVLAPNELLDIKTTLVAARSLARTFERLAAQYPCMSALTVGLPPPVGLVDAISRAISERGEILDFASDKLASIRRELKVAYERLMSKLERIVNDPRNAPILQESIITQRNGRYVVPLRADFKGRMRSIVHDQSASGATLFVEPLVVVELNNHWRELQLAERDEERRILAELSHEVGLHASQIVGVVETLAALDLCLMRAKYAYDLHASEPVLVPFRKHDSKPSEDKAHPGSAIRLFQARHPLLDPAKVVPVDVDLDAETFVVIITGPNTGGKTVTLKTVGLFVLMAQSGMHIPAQSGSEISVFESVYADIGDEQSIEQSLSTFSGHVTNLVHILNEADHTSLVLLDELGAGTDPQEGAALARAVLDFLLERRITSLVATHYPELKAYAHATRGVTNASVEFDLQTLRPTYHLTIGLPGRSNALAIAERLGLPAQIVNAARSTIHPDELRAEDLLDEIHRQRDLTRQARAAAENIQRDVESLRSELTRRFDGIEDERRTILERARAEAGEEVADLRLEMDDVRRQLSRARQPLEVIKSLDEQLQEVADEVEKPVERKKTRVGKSTAAVRQPLRLGEKIKLRSLKMAGIVTSLGENEIEVQVGALRVRARLADVQRRDEEDELEPMVALAPTSTRQTLAQASGSGLFSASPGLELDLRGQRAEDALEALDRYLESAFMASLPFVRIIHGKGTGRLRQVVREALHDSPHVNKFESGQDNEGGDGVTVAKLAVD